MLAYGAKRWFLVKPRDAEFTTVPVMDWHARMGLAVISSASID